MIIAFVLFIGSNNQFGKYESKIFTEVFWPIEQMIQLNEYQTDPYFILIRSNHDNWLFVDLAEFPCFYLV